MTIAATATATATLLGIQEDGGAVFELADGWRRVIWPADGMALSGHEFLFPYGETRDLDISAQEAVEMIHGLAAHARDLDHERWSVAPTSDDDKALLRAGLRTTALLGKLCPAYGAPGTVTTGPYGVRWSWSQDWAGTLSRRMLGA
jgi:hypothetical protein